MPSTHAHRTIVQNTIRLVPNFDIPGPTTWLNFDLRQQKSHQTKKRHCICLEKMRKKFHLAQFRNRNISYHENVKC